MYELKVNNKTWQISNFDEGGTNVCQLTLFFADTTIKAEELIEDLQGVSEGFTFADNEYTNYSLQDVHRTGDERGIRLVAILRKNEPNG